MALMTNYLADRIDDYCRINHLNKDTVHKNKDLLDKAIEYAKTTLNCEYGNPIWEQELLKASKILRLNL